MITDLAKQLVTCHVISALFAAPSPFLTQTFDGQVRARKTVERMQTTKAQLNSVSMTLTTQYGTRVLF